LWQPLRLAGEEIAGDCLPTSRQVAQGLEPVDASPEITKTCVNHERGGVKKSVKVGASRTTLPPESRKASADGDLPASALVVGTTSGPQSTTGSPASTASADTSADLGGGLPAIADLRDTSAFANPAASAAQEAQLPPEVQAAIQGLSEAQRQTLLALLMRQSSRHGESRPD